MGGDNSVDEPSSKSCEQEVDPGVPEIQDSDFTNQISELVKEILELEPPMLNKDVNVFSGDTNVDSNTDYKGPHCLKCGLEVKGHKENKMNKNRFLLVPLVFVTPQVNQTFANAVITLG